MGVQEAQPSAINQLPIARTEFSMGLHTRHLIGLRKQDQG
jgi:hypothetical protein